MKNSLFNHLHFEEIDSTSAYLKREYKNLSDFTFVSADYQSSGKGREQRQWISDKGANLLFSILIKDKNLLKEYSSLSLATAASIGFYLINKGIKGVEVKWPNDVYIKGKKIAGILLEGNVDEYITIGIGLNVNQMEFNSELRNPATSIVLETNKTIGIESVQKELFELLFNDLNIKNIREKHYLNFIFEHDYLKGKLAYVDINGIKTEVKIVGINENNALIVSNQNQSVTIISGEVTLK